MGGRGKLAAWNERRAVLQGQVDAFTNEMAQLDALGRADLGCGLVAHIDGAGSLRINAGSLTPPEATLALRDHLCNVLGLPERFQDVTTLSDEEARKLAVDLVERAAGGVRNTQVLFATACEAIINALDHVGVIRSDTLPTRAPGLPDEQQGARQAVASANPSGSAPAAGTSGSAHYQVSLDSSSLHRVIEILGNAVKPIERVHNRTIMHNDFAEVSKQLSEFTTNLGLETTRVTKSANPNAASEDWDALHGINADGNATKTSSPSIDLKA